MQRLNRSAHAPVGVAFFLFLGLAILPASLRVAGVQISFSPRLSAAMDAWEQISQVFGAGSQPAAELSVVRDVDSSATSPVHASVNPFGEFACTRNALRSCEKSNDVPESLDHKESAARNQTSRIGAPNYLAKKRVASVDAARASSHALAISVLGAITLETITRDERFKRIDARIRPNFEASAHIGNLPFPLSKNLKALVRAKRVAASSSAKGAESKVFVALDAARKHECYRAMLTGPQMANPDYSEF